MAEPLTSDDPREVAGYRLRARLGAGGMGRVYLAITPGGRRVALKMVHAEFGGDEEFRARFRQEVMAAQRVHGLFTAQVLDADPDAPQPWLATAYLPGLSLRQAVSEFGPLPQDSVVLLIAGIAEALHAIHAVGIVHRDLKPANVILAADGPRVIDFGIARAAAAPAITAGGSRLGSPRFMAPEQARGQQTSPAVDVFALGSLATYASSGRPPFGTDKALAVLSRILNEPPDLDGCPVGLRPLIERCLAKDPVQRPQPSEILAACRAMNGDGVLSFEQSWLPPAVCAAAAAAAAASAAVAPAAAGGVSRAGAAGGGVSPGGAAGGYPASAVLTPAVAITPTAAFAAAAGVTVAGAAGHDQADPETGGTDWTYGSQPGPVPDPLEPSRAEQAAPAQPAPQPGIPATGTAFGPPRPRTGQNARPKTVTAMAGAGVALLASIMLLTAASTSDGRQPHQPQGLSGGASQPGPAPGMTPRAAYAGAPGTGHAVAGSHMPTAMSGPAASGSQSRVGSTPSPAASMVAPSASSSSPAAPTSAPTTAAASGQAAFAGTWSGTVSEPGWNVTSWTVQLVIPASGQLGTYSAPSLSCSGTFQVTGNPTTTMTGLAKTTSAVNAGCVKVAHVTLSLAGSGELTMTWVPTGKNKSPGSTTLFSG